MDFRNVFSAVDDVIGNVRDLLNEVASQVDNCMATVERSLTELEADPNDSSWIYYKTISTSQPNTQPLQGFQTVTEICNAPGGIKETREVHKNWQTGVEKTSIGHHINDRAHIIQKVKNNNTGNEEVKQTFVNLNEAEADAFDREWRNGIRRFHPYGRRGNAPRYGRVHDANRSGATRSGMNNPIADEELGRPRLSVRNRNVKGSCAKNSNKNRQ